MKIAIQGHQTREKEVAQILESLGGKNSLPLEGYNQYAYYSIYENHIMVLSNFTKCKRYTLEEFEKEFPFKIGDKVTIAGLPDFPKIITKIAWDCDTILYSFEDSNNTWFGADALKKFEMKEERNITLTLDKAKEWYKKGGELREIALQVFTEKELNLLPRSWEEFCKQGNPLSSWRYNIPIKYEALFKLEQLRNCYNNSCNDISRIAIINNNGNIELYVDPPFNCFLTFKNHLLAREFFSNFKEIIEIAKELI